MSDCFVNNLSAQMWLELRPEGSNALTYLTIQLQLSYGAITYFSSTIKQPQLEPPAVKINKRPSGWNN